MSGLGGAERGTGFGINNESFERKKNTTEIAGKGSRGEQYIDEKLSKADKSVFLELSATIDIKTCKF